MQPLTESVSVVKYHLRSCSNASDYRQGLAVQRRPCPELHLCVCVLPPLLFPPFPSSHRLFPLALAPLPPRHFPPTPAQAMYTGAGRMLGEHLYFLT